MRLNIFLNKHIISLIIAIFIFLLYFLLTINPPTFFQKQPLNKIKTTKWTVSGKIPCNKKEHPHCTPQGLTVSEGNLILSISYGNNESSRIFEINPENYNNESLAYFDMPIEATHTSGLDWDGDFLWAIDNKSKFVYQIDKEASFRRKKAQIISKFKTNIKNPSAICIVPYKDNKNHILISSFQKSSRKALINPGNISKSGTIKPSDIEFEYYNDGFSQGLACLNNVDDSKDTITILETNSKIGKDVINITHLKNNPSDGIILREDNLQQILAPSKMVEDIAYDSSTKTLWTTDEATLKIYKSFIGNLNLRNNPSNDDDLFNLLTDKINDKKITTWLLFFGIVFLLYHILFIWITYSKKTNKNSNLDKYDIIKNEPVFKFVLYELEFQYIGIAFILIIITLLSLWITYNSGMLFNDLQISENKWRAFFSYYSFGSVFILVLPLCMFSSLIFYTTIPKILEYFSTPRTINNTTYNKFSIITFINFINSKSVFIFTIFVSILIIIGLQVSWIGLGSINGDIGYAFVDLFIQDKLNPVGLYFMILSLIIIYLIINLVIRILWFIFLLWEILYKKSFFLKHIRIKLNPLHPDGKWGLGNIENVLLWAHLACSSVIALCILSVIEKFMFYGGYSQNWGNLIVIFQNNPITTLVFPIIIILVEPFIIWIPFFVSKHIIEQEKNNLRSKLMEDIQDIKEINVKQILLLQHINNLPVNIFNISISKIVLSIIPFMPLITKLLNI